MNNGKLNDTTPSASAAPHRASSPDQSRPKMATFMAQPAVRSVVHDAGYDDEMARQLGELLQMEWVWFDVVHNIGQRALCQDDAQTFFINRAAQYLSFPRTVIPLIYKDCSQARAMGRNFIEEKYVRMMRKTEPELYEHECATWLGELSPVHKEVLAELEILLTSLVAQAREEYPEADQYGRVEQSCAEEISSSDYFICEVASYSLGTLYELISGITQQVHDHTNFIEDTYAHAVVLLKAVEA